MNVCAYQSIKAILENILDSQSPETPSEPLQPVDHPNLRGPGYFDSGNNPTLPLVQKEEKSC